MDNTNDKSQKLQSNEEVIEELTKDLESSCIRVNENSTESTSSNTDAETRNTTSDSWDVIDQENSKISEDNAQDTEILDEESLKDRDVNLTEAEKEVFKMN